MQTFLKRFVKKVFQVSVSFDQQFELSGHISPHKGLKNRENGADLSKTENLLSHTNTKLLKWILTYDRK